ncbi:MAG: type I methionyl aminopeptidase [Clostridiales bacterium]|nr:type I methionyl aminopeptidase [Clostridiales bacterium]
MICKTQDDINGMLLAGKLTAEALKYAESLIKPNISTLELDKLIEKYIIDRGAKPSFLHYEGYPASICASVNSYVVHGIPSKDVILKEGDIISIDVGVIINGYNGDAARTFPVGKISPDKERLIRVTKECFFEGIKNLAVGKKLGELSFAIQNHAESNGYSVVRELVGHGIGHNMHEAPEVPNYGLKTSGVRVKEGMCLAVEPMINMGERYVYVAEDGWGIITRDGKPSAHYENTVIVTSNGVLITTLQNEDFCI